jgi:hypothetical protein
VDDEDDQFELAPGLLASIEAFRNRRRYSLLDLPTLRSIPDSVLDQAVIDYILSALDKTMPNTRDAVAALGEGFLTVYCTWIAEVEVGNGGFNQFFWNTSEQCASDLPRALRTIGALRAAEIAQAALLIAHEETVRRNTVRDKTNLQAFSDSYQTTDLGILDSDFWQEAREFSNLRVKYIRQNEGLFVTVS